MLNKDEMKEKLQGFTIWPNDWEGDQILQTAVDLGIKAIDLGYIVTSVGPDVMGAVALYNYQEEDKMSWLSCWNNGEVLALYRKGNENVRLVEVANMEEELIFWNEWANDTGHL